MDPATIAALLGVVLKLIDYVEASGVELDDEMLDARTEFRRALVAQATSESAPDPE